MAQVANVSVDTLGVDAALQRLICLAQRAGEAEVLQIDEIYDRVLIALDGKIHEYPVPFERRKRQHTAADLASLVTLAAVHQRLNPGSMPVFFVAADAVRLLCDDRDQRNAATMSLHPSAFQRAIHTLANSAFKQADLLRMLRVTLADNGGAEIAPTYKKLRFFNEQITEGVIDPTRESLGSDVRRELTGDVDLPAEHTFRGEWYVELDGMPFEVRCAVDVNHAAGTIGLKPVGDTIARVTRASLEAIGDALAEEIAGCEGLASDSATVVYGTP